MTDDHGGNAASVQEETPPSSRRSWRLRALPLVLAAGLAMCLASPGFRTAFVFDDYDFLNRVQTPGLGRYLPDSTDVFYRPISRELYFGFLQSIAPGNALPGHVINAVFLIAVILLGSALVTRIAGIRAGIVAGVLLAAFGQWPVLVSWVCGSQELFAIGFLLLALHLELSGARGEALLLFALAVLSKETAVVAAPALVAIPWLQRNSRRESFIASMQVGALLLPWVLFHPGVQSLIVHGGLSSHGSYIGLDNSARWGSLLGYLPTLANVPLTGYPTPWPSELTMVLAFASVPFLGLLGVMVWSRKQVALGSEPPSTWNLSRSLLFGALLGGPALVLTCLIVKNWAPYYACLPAVGFVVAMSPRLATMPPRRLSVLLTLYLVLGVWSRGIELKQGMPTERGMGPAGIALGKLERNFKRVAPTLPSGSIVYVSTMAVGTQSVYLHLHTLQALRVWYHDPTIQTLRPELHVISDSPEFMFWIDPKLHVFRLDPQTLSVRSDGSSVEVPRYRSAVRSYAIGLGEAGEVQRATDILLHIDDPASWDHAINYRIAAMLLYSNGEDSTADKMLRGVPELPPSSAFDAVGNMLTVPTPSSRPLERSAIRAFGFSWDDPKVLAALMRALSGLGYNEVSERLAQRVLILRPGDEEATGVLAKAARAGELERPAMP